MAQCDLCRFKAETGFIEFDVEDDTDEPQHIVLCIDCFKRSQMSGPLLNVHLLMAGRYTKKED